MTELTLAGPVIGTPPDVHAGLLDRLDAVRDFIAAHPSFGVTCVDVHASGFTYVRKFCGSKAEVDYRAARIGVAARWRSATQYAAHLKCGQACEYELVYLVQPEAADQDPRGSVREMTGVA